jgi:hypothetical protein
MILVVNMGPQWGIAILTCVCIGKSIWWDHNRENFTCILKTFFSRTTGPEKQNIT